MHFTNQNIQKAINTIAVTHVAMVSVTLLYHFARRSNIFGFRFRSYKDRKNLRDFEFEELLNDKKNGEYVVAKGKINGEVALVKLSAKNLPALELVQRLPQLSLQLHSESGAEYAYFQASLPHSPHPLLAGPPPRTYQVEMICPASERQVARSRAVAIALVEETAEDYQNVTEPFIRKVIGDGSSIQWVYNILEKKKEVERIIFDSGGTGPEDFLINIDTKWKNHPDPKTVPMAEWKEHIKQEDVYCLGIIQLRGIHSLRALTAAHLPLLEAMLQEGQAAIERVYNVPKEELRVFVHYQPQFYHFHVHYAHITNELGVTVERAHLLKDIIQNLTISPEYYANRTMTYRLQTSDALYKEYNGNTNKK